jgi:hypothetical protein
MVTPLLLLQVAVGGISDIISRVASERNIMMPDLQVEATSSVYIYNSNSTLLMSSANPHFKYDAREFGPNSA